MTCHDWRTRRLFSPQSCELYTSAKRLDFCPRQHIPPCEFPAPTFTEVCRINMIFLPIIVTDFYKFLFMIFNLGFEPKPLRFERTALPIELIEKFLFQDVPSRLLHSLLRNKIQHISCVSVLSTYYTVLHEYLPRLTVTFSINTDTLPLSYKFSNSVSTSYLFNVMFVGYR